MTALAARRRSRLASLVLVMLGLIVTGVAYAALAPGRAVAAETPQEQVAAGRALFLANCAACHGTEGKGDGPKAAGLDPPPADLTSGHAAAHRDRDLFFWIENGVDGTAMPAFGERLADEEIRHTITYIRSLQPSATTGGRPTDGPSTPVVE